MSFRLANLFGIVAALGERHVFLVSFCQSRTLATLRDTLLPKLLSGELSALPEAQGMEVAR
jgi:hypothetical protein